MIVAPETRDLETLAASLRGWLQDRMPGADDLRVIDLHYPLGAGMSHETILFDAEWRERGEVRRRGLVVRIKPSRKTVYHDDMFVEQYQLMKLAHDRSSVRVAAPLWFETEFELLGAPFFVMEKVAGRVAVSYPPYSKEGWLADQATPAERRRMWEDAVRQLALIQHIPISDAGFLAGPGGLIGFEQEVDRWRRFLAWIDAPGELSLMHEGFERLLALAPANRPEGIVWGDARLGNMMFSDDFNVVAVMDWEQPSLGGALHDLGWWLTSDRNATDLQGLATLDGMGSREETIALWSEVSGKSAEGIEWYEAFVVFKQDCLATRMMETHDMGERAARFVPGRRTLAALDQL